jgi:hypothetical protein
MKSTKLLLFAFLFTVSTCYAQDLINLVPKDAAFTAVFDINQINTKAKFSQLAKLPVVEKIAKGLVRNIIKQDSLNYLDLTKYGIKVNSKAYFYFQSSDKVYYGAMVFSLEDEAKFMHLAKLLTGDTEGQNIKTKDNYKYAVKRDIKIVWNNKTAAFWMAIINPGYKDSVKSAITSRYTGSINGNNSFPAFDKPVEEASSTGAYNENAIADSIAVVEYLAREEERVKSIADSIAATDSYNSNVAVDSYNPTVDTSNTYYNYDTPADPYDRMYTLADSVSKAASDSIVNGWCAINSGLFLREKGNNSMAFNKEFMDYVKNNPDVAFMFDYGLFTKIYLKSMWSYTMRTTGDPYQFLQGMYDGTKMFAKVELNKDDVQLKFNMTYSNKLAEIFKYVKKKKISTNFLKYMDKDLMGYYAVGIDIEGYSKGIGKMLKDILPTIPEYGNIAASALDVLDIAIDEQSLYKLLTGDMVLAVNGVKPMQVTRKSYDYDAEFNSKEKIDTTIQTQPDVLFMLGIGNINDVNKILKLLIDTKSLKKEGNLYQIEAMGSPLPVYLTIQDGILFIGNNKENLAKPVLNMPGEEHTKLFNKNTFVAYANMDNIAKYFIKEGSDKNQKIFTDVLGFCSSMSVCGSHKGNASSSNFVLKLKNTEDNSIFDICKFINTLFLIDENTNTDSAL